MHEDGRGADGGQQDKAGGCNPFPCPAEHCSSAVDWDSSGEHGRRAGSNRVKVQGRGLCLFVEPAHDRGVIVRNMQREGLPSCISVCLMVSYFPYGGTDDGVFVGAFESSFLMSRGSVYVHPEPGCLPDSSLAHQASFCSPITHCYAMLPKAATGDKASQERHFFAIQILILADHISYHP